MERASSAAHPVVVALGTRPEAIKLAPVILALRKRRISTLVLSTGQHREMLDQTLKSFDLTPDRDYRLMRANQSLAGLSAGILTAVDETLRTVEPSCVLVQGDTTTVAMVALAAFYRKVPVVHVEAGLRTHDKYDPFPEEMNRTLVSSLADLHFAPTPSARSDLLSQGVDAERIHLVGNTVIDALRNMQRRVGDQPLADFGLSLSPNRLLLLVTGHRRENFGDGLRGVFQGVRALAEEFRDQVEVLCPVHLNPNVRGLVRETLSGLANVQLTDPLDYAAFVKVMTSAHVIITDSGGVQEEAAALGVPLIVTRRTSERQEAVDSGVAELVGTDPDKLVAAGRRLLTEADYYSSRAVATDAFGDGCSGDRIADIVIAELERTRGECG